MMRPRTAACLSGLLLAHVAVSSFCFTFTGVGITASSGSSSSSSSRGGRARGSATSLCMALKGMAKKAKEREVAEARAELEANAPSSPVLEYLRDGLAQAGGDKRCSVLTKVLTKPNKTLSVVAEYRRNLKSGFVAGVLAPELLSPLFRKGGASAVCIATDKVTGGCSHDDVRNLKAEQQSAAGDFPGPLDIIVRDIVVDEFQIAEAKDLGAAGVTLQMGILEEVGRCKELIDFAHAIGMEPVLDVVSEEEIGKAVEAGATIINVCKPAEEAKTLWKSIPEGVHSIATVERRSDEGCDEIEECWALRDLGFNSIWASEVLYKGGQEQSESIVAAIKAIRSKANIKFGRARTMSGRGEGAREYLGTFEM